MPEGGALPHYPPPVKDRRPSAAAPERKPPKDLANAIRQRLIRARDPQKARERNNLRHAARTPAEKLERVWKQLARPPTPAKSSKSKNLARRRAVSIAYYDWSDLEAVFRMYQAAAVMTELTGNTYVVDHWVPLQSPLVCGLHVHTNMRVCKDTENNLKGNKFWPGMPEYDWETMEMLLNWSEKDKIH